MNRPQPPAPLASLDDVHALDGKIVLVSSQRDHRTPATALRGTLEVRDSAEGVPTVSIAVEFPQMFSERAHRRTLPLDRAALLRLLESEENGTYSYRLDGELR